ncbi:MAG: hypothetical protein ACTSRZ_21160 [Promethearchaeota archaeon]
MNSKIKNNLRNLKLLFIKNPRQVFIFISTVIFIVILTFISLNEDNPKNKMNNYFVLFILYSIVNIISSNAYGNFKKSLRHLNIMPRDDEVIKYYSDNKNNGIKLIEFQNKKYPITIELGPGCELEKRLNGWKKNIVKHLFDFSLDIDFRFIDASKSKENARSLLELSYDELIWGFREFSNIWNQLRLKHIFVFPDWENIEREKKLIYYVGTTTYLDQALIGYSAEYKINPKMSIRDLFSPYLGLYLKTSVKIMEDICNEVLKNESIENTIKTNLCWNPTVNSMGIGTLIITKDGYIVFPKRKMKQASEEGKFDVGISGAISLYSFFQGKYSKETLSLKNILESELYEKGELAIPNNTEYKFILLNIMRNITRLGSIVINGITILNENFEKIAENWWNYWNSKNPKKNRKNNWQEFSKLYYIKMNEYDRNEQNSDYNLFKNMTIDIIKRVRIVILNWILESKENNNNIKLYLYENNKKDKKSLFNLSLFNYNAISIFYSLENLHDLKK